MQNGCDHRCTYCIIPYGRGNSRSVPIGVIVEQVKYLVAEGYNEVVFTGVDVTAYGSDLPGRPTFAQMIKRLLNLVPELKRLRLSSIDVAEIDDELFELMAFEERLMPHFHISLQSGDNMILKRMKRRHNRELVIDFCNRLRNKRPNVAFGADIIAGFPTENTSMFNNTRMLIKEADLQYLHIFPYSPRENTPAARMPQIERIIKKERAAELRALGELQLERFFKRSVGSKVNLLIEKEQVAHSENFIPVRMEKLYTQGSLITAELKGLRGKYMVAEEFV